MNTDLLMELADGRSPDALVATVLKHHPHWSGFVPVEELCQAVNITDIQPLEADAFEGALVTDEDKQRGVIFYKKGRPEKRRRFTIGHELGHFLIPSHDGQHRCTLSDMSETRRDTDHRRREVEANRFAAGLLMPKPWFIRDIRSLGAADVSHVQTLSDHYKTSLEATINRYAELTDDTCAFVFAQHGVVRYVRPTKEFPRLAVARGDRLPTGCVSARPYSGPLRTPSSWSEIDGGVWLETERGTRSAQLQEQTMHQQDGFQVTLLFLDDVEMEEREEDGEVERSWQPRFRR
jgi:Zn-dependent peptidase ImmA (M78 family)